METSTIIETLNEFLEEENGLPITIDSYLLDSDMDSFAYTVFWFKVAEEYGCVDEEYVKNINYNTYEVKELVEKIQNEC